MHSLTIANRTLLPALLLGTIMVATLLCIAHLGYGHETWLMQNWDLPYAGCSNWCS